MLLLFETLYFSCYFYMAAVNGRLEIGHAVLFITFENVFL